MKVLSLFDGISCGRVAFERAGIHISTYYASEVDKHAITIAKKNHPSTVQVGDVRIVRKMAEAGVFGKIDFLIGGSPCQGFSFAGKQLAFDDPRSVLFFEYVAILNALRKVNPDIKFLLENVKMKKEHLAVITEQLGVEPVCINSALVSAQNRIRYYWCNWKVEQPDDRGIMLKDVVHENMDLSSAEKEGWVKWFKENAEYQLSKKYSSLNSEKVITMTARQYASWNGNFILESLSKYIVPFDDTLKILNKEVEKGKVGYFRTDSQANRVYYIHDKAVTLCGDSGGGAAKMGQYLFGCITPDRIEKRQNGQRFNDGNKFYTLTAQDKHGILTEGYIRKLTPIECERLQTLPDNYTEGVSNSQRYKMLGNGWTIDVIAHILRGAV
jgi:DNA (cytosine-5)-methyltransferase 3A